MKNVLLIDDDPDEAIFFSQALSDLSLAMNFRYIGNGIETVPELLKKDGYVPDVIFMDINMPMTNGWECLRDLKSLSEFQKIPIIMYSTANIESGGMAASDVGATAFMTKPTTYSELQSRLSSVIHTLFSF